MQHVLGAAVVLAAAAAFLQSRRGRRGLRFLAAPRLTPAARRAAMVALAVGAAIAALPAFFPPLRKGIFALCGACPVLPVAQTTGTAAAHGTPVGEFLLAAWYYAATVLPVFVLAALLSGVLLARSDRFRISGAWRSFGLAALLPVCSCGVVPLARAIIARGGTGRRDGLIFLATAPLLSPIIIVLSFAVLGPSYALLRIAASVIVAFAVALLVGPLIPEPKADADDSGPSPGIETTAVTGGAAPGSVLEAGFSMLSGLLRYALYGVVVGAAFTALLPAEAVVSLLRPGVMSMAAAVVVGLPVNMCGGEEILISAPLVGMGLGPGHAIAFALASTGICLGSIPLLDAVLGRRAVIAFAATYVVVPFALGLLIGLLPMGGAPA